MTRAEFLDALAELKGARWTVNKLGALRCEKGFCPIVAVADARGVLPAYDQPNDEAEQIGVDLLKLSDVEPWDIMDAADCHQDPDFPDLREDMLRVLGLSESRS